MVFTSHVFLFYFLPAFLLVHFSLPFRCRNLWITAASYVTFGKKVFQYMYWHDKQRLGYGNVLFVDSHLGYHQATTDKPNFQRGSNWSFVYNDD